MSLLADISSELLYPVIPVYLKSIGYSFLYIGLLEGMAELTAGLTKGYFGKLSDKLQRRVVFIRTGYGFSTVGRIILTFTHQLAGVFLARFTDRLGKGIRTSARDAYLSSQTTKDKLASVFGFHRAMDTFGAVLGPVIAIILLHFFPGQYTLIFMIAIVPSLLSVGITFMLKEDKKEARVFIGDKKIPGFFSYFKYWKEANNSYRALVVPLLLFAIVNSADVFLLLKIKAAGYSDIMMIGCYIAYNLLYALLSFPIGIMADKIGRKTILCVGFILFAITYCGFAMATSLWQFYVLFFVYAVFAACNESVAKSMLAAQSEEKDRATALGFYESGRSLAALIASTWTGLMWSKGNPAMAFYISATITIIVFLIVILHKKSRKSETPSHLVT